MRVQEITKSNGQTRYVLIGDNGNLIIPVARYLKYLDSVGRARNTLRAYTHDLRLFFEYLQQKGIDYTQVTLDDMGAFVLFLKNPYASTDLLPRLPIEQARENRTINRCLTAVSGFYDYLWRQEDLTADLHPVTHELRQNRSTFKGFLHHIAKDRLIDANILRQKEPKSRPKTLTKEQIVALVDACVNIRDKLLVTLLFEASMRIGEALSLWLEDVDIPKCRLHIRDRGELINQAEIKTPYSVRSVDVSRDLINQIMDYIADVHTDEVETNHLFIKLHGARVGQPLTYPDVNDLFQRLAEKTGIYASAHLLRHSSLTNLARAGWKPEHLRERAGHAHFQTTYQMYVHPNDDDLRADWERTEASMRLNQTNKENP